MNRIGSGTFFRASGKSKLNILIFVFRPEGFWFHLGNGASLYQIHEGADLSPRGQKQSYGLMVNYLYEREKLIENHEKFVKDGDIKAQPKLHELARKYKDKLSEKS